MPRPAGGGRNAPATNPQVADATADGAQNTVPSFITSTGRCAKRGLSSSRTRTALPTRTRQRRRGGSVHDHRTQRRRPCSIGQPGFASQQANNNVIFRIPTPTFGTGLIETISEETLLNNQQSAFNNNQGITGTFNHNGNDGTISRSVGRPRNKSLELFAGEAYNVEQGVTNEIFTQERPLPGEDMGIIGGHSSTNGLPANCRGNATPEDHTNFNQTAIGTPSDLVQFAMFMRLLAPPTPSTTVPGGATSINNGRSLFISIGCAICHTATLTTGTSSFTSSLSNAPANLFSDLEIHHMGTTLADNVSQGGAGGDQFRTAPLWGAGQRIFFLHDGRTKDIQAAILAHNASGSEANGPSFTFFQNLSTSQRQDILNFLRSL